MSGTGRARRAHRERGGRSCRFRFTRASERYSPRAPALGLAPVGGEAPRRPRQWRSLRDVHSDATLSNVLSLEERVLEVPIEEGPGDRLWSRSGGDGSRDVAWTGRATKAVPVGRRFHSRRYRVGLCRSAIGTDQVRWKVSPYRTFRLLGGESEIATVRYTILERSPLDLSRDRLGNETAVRRTRQGCSDPPRGALDVVYTIVPDQVLSGAGMAADSLDGIRSSVIE